MTGHPLAKRGAPHGPPYRPSDAPPGPMATASLTGHLRALYWPSGEASHWPKGRPRLATGRGPSPGPPPTGQRDGRGCLWPHGSSSPPLPGHLWPKGSHTTHWPQRDGLRREAFAPPPTGLPLAKRDGEGTPSPGPPLTYGEPPAPSPHWPPMPSPPHQPIEAFGRVASPLPD